MFQQGATRCKGTGKTQASATRESLTQRHSHQRLTEDLLWKYDEHHMPIIKTGSKKEETRARILRAAARAIRKHGYEGVGVADVMKEAGLTHGGFYAHFKSRDA